jgi:predicted nucleic acid-binding Zn ribbon protein
MSESWFQGAAWCTRCLAWKPAEDFPANPRMRDGRSSHCRVCHAAASKRWREANRDYVDAVNAARREEYAAEHGQLERQCENPECGRTFERSRRDAKTCSEKCRDRLKYLRRRGGK